MEARAEVGFFFLILEVITVGGAKPLGEYRKYRFGLTVVSPESIAIVDSEDFVVEVVVDVL